jgi:hypothetical protein
MSMTPLQNFHFFIAFAPDMDKIIVAKMLAYKNENL